MTTTTDTAGGMMITRFAGPYEFLANPWRCPVRFEDIDFPGAEWAFQAAKSLDWAFRVMISQMPSWRDAKRAGRAVTLRPDWELVKRSVMMRIVLIKFTQNAGLDRLLATTRGCTLVEGNTWADMYWGATLQPADAHTFAPLLQMPQWPDGQGGILAGHNWLGRILMMTRDLTDLGI